MWSVWGVASRGHVRIGVVAWRVEGLLDGARRDPSDQVVPRAGLVVGATGARAAEGLLTDDRPGGLVVDVEVARRVPQLLAGPVHRPPVGRKDRAGQRVRAGRLGQAYHRFELRVGVDVDTQDRPEVLHGEDLVARVGALHHGGAHEETGRVVGRAAG